MPEDPPFPSGSDNRGPTGSLGSGLGNHPQNGSWTPTWSPWMIPTSSRGSSGMSSMFLAWMLRILNPNMTDREELAIHGQVADDGIQDSELTNPNVGPLAIRRKSEVRKEVQEPVRGEDFQTYRRLKIGSI